MDKKISVVYITKNESVNLQKSIESCKDIADEIIVVDTGSTDNTKEMLSQYRDIIIKDFKWVNDFSKARNYALDQCHFDYILFLDSDERFEKKMTIEDKKPFLDLFENGAIDILTFMEKDIEEDTNVEHYTTFEPRAFRRDNDIRYVKSIHENICSLSNKQLASKAVGQYCLLHTGYSKKIIESKVQRNIELLEAVVNPYTMDYFYLCREYLSLKNYDKSWDYCNKFFAQDDFMQYIKNTDIAYTIYFFKAILMQENKKYTVKEIIKFLENEKNVLGFLPQYYFELGRFYYNLDFSKSEEYFKEALLIQKTYLEKGYTYLNNFEGFKSELYSFLGRIEFLKKNYQNAINKAGVACVYNPKNIDNFVLLTTFLSHDRDIKTIEKNLNFIYQIYMPATKDDFIFISKALGASNLTEEFVYNTMTVLKNFPLTPEDSFDEAYYAELFATNSAKNILEKLKDNNTNASKLIKLCSIIYQNAVGVDSNMAVDNFLILSKMGEEYIEVYNILTKLELPNILTEKTKELLYQVIIKLVHLGFVGFNRDFLKVLFKCYNYSKPVSDILKIWLSDYNKQEIAKAVEFLEEIAEEEIEDKERYYNDYFYLLYLLEEYNKIIIKSQEVPKEYLSYNFIKFAKPNKNYIKAQRELCSGG